MALNPSLVKNAIQFVSTLGIDNIVRVYQGSYDAGAQPNYGGYMKIFTIAHGLPRPVFTKLLWSTDNVNFVDGGFSFRSGDVNRYPALSYSDSTNIYIITGLTAGTIYYKVIAYWIDDYDNTNPSVPSYFNTPVDKYINFNSNDNYQKKWIQGVATVSGASQTVNITHNMGYLPNTRVFFEAFSNQVWPAIAGGASNFYLWDFTNQGEVEVLIYNNVITLNWVGTASTTNRKIWYTIYTDD